MAETIEVEFRLWVGTKFTKLKEYIVTQFKEAKNHDKTLQELTDKIASIEKNVTDLIELQNTLQEFHNAITSINCRIDQAEESISEPEDCLYEVRQAVDGCSTPAWHKYTYVINLHVVHMYPRT